MFVTGGPPVFRGGAASTSKRSTSHSPTARHAALNVSQVRVEGSCHSFSGRSPRAFESVTARARRRAFSSSTHSTSSGGGESSSGKVPASSSRGDSISRNWSGTALSAPEDRSFLLRGLCSMPMASPSTSRTCPQSAADLSPKWDGRESNARTNFSAVATSPPSRRGLLPEATR